jgi:hypothetical protein
MRPPHLDDYLRLFKRIENLSVQTFIPQLAVEGFAVSLLPRTAGFDKQRLRAHRLQPGSDTPRGISAPLSERTSSGTPCASMHTPSSSITCTLFSRRANRQALACGTNRSWSEAAGCSRHDFAARGVSRPDRGYIAKRSEPIWKYAVAANDSLLKGGLGLREKNNRLVRRVLFFCFHGWSSALMPFLNVVDRRPQGLTRRPPLAGF